MGERMIEGLLVENSDGRFFIKGHPQSYFTSGEILEINLGGHWIRARMEFNHSHESYMMDVASGINHVALIHPLGIWARTIR
jgi:hypothetical protein